MNKKILFLVMAFLMVGVVSADRSLSNVVGIDIPANIVAGSPFEASFSFDYYYGGDNEGGSPLIIELNVSSLEEPWCNGADTDNDGVVDAADYIAVKSNFGMSCTEGDYCSGADIDKNLVVDWEDLQILQAEMGRDNCGVNGSAGSKEYPVWKGDFNISGTVEKKWFFNTLTDVIEFNCSEKYEQTIEHPLDAQNVTAPDGVFYCYNEEGDLKLNENDKVTLNIIPNKALYPGKYNFSATMFYLTDERAPFVNITNKGLFEKYYRENDNVEIFASIDDGSEIDDKWGEAFLGYENWTIPFIEKSGDYRFSGNTPVDIVEGDYPLYVFAEDEYNNTGNDSVTLKIDRSAPNITLVKPNGSIYEDILPIEVSVSDAKAGLDSSEVYYRLREMNGSNICPEDGDGTWNCYNSGWLSLPNTSGDLFGINVNTTEVGLNGEYWLQIRASDILGNEGVLE